MICFLEIGEFSLRIARFETVEEMAKVHLLTEIWRHNEDEFPGFIYELAQSIQNNHEPVVASVYAGERFFRLLSAAQVAELPGGEEALQFLEDKLPASAASAAYFFLDTSNGGALHFGHDGAAGLVAAVTGDSLQKTLSFCAENGLPVRDLQMASTRQLGALQSFINLQNPEAPVIHLEIGETHSHLHILSTQGLEMVSSIPFALDSIVDGIQEELGMQYRGSALKLLFLGEYDFSEIATTLITPLAQGVAAQLEAFVNNGGQAPEQMVISGLPQKQNWISAELGRLLEMQPLQIDMFSWLEDNGIMLEETAFDQDISPSWIGFFQRIGQIARGDDPETLAWASPLIDEPVEAQLPPAPTIAEPVAVPASAPRSTPAPTTKPLKPAVPFWKTPAGYSSIGGGVLVLIILMLLVFGGEKPEQSGVRPGTTTTTRTSTVGDPTAPTTRTHVAQPNRIFGELPPVSERSVLAFDERGRLVWETFFRPNENYRAGSLHGQNNWRATPGVQLRQSAGQGMAMIPSRSNPEHLEHFFNVPGEVLRFTMRTVLQRGAVPDPGSLREPSSVLVTVNNDGYLVGYDGFEGRWIVSDFNLPNDGEPRLYEFLMNYETKVWTLLINGDLVFSRFGFRDTSLDQLTRLRITGSENSANASTQVGELTILPPDERGVMRR